MATRLQLYREKWKDGCGSEYCSRACNIVHTRGKIPCDVLFVGEAPGNSEDSLGVPFVGPAGKLLDHIVAKGLAGAKVLVPNNSEVDVLEPRVAFANIVGCMPKDEGGSKEGEPSFEAIQSCKPRLEELIRLANPRLLVAVGKLSADAFKTGLKTTTKIPQGCKILSITHPAAILRANIAQQGLLIQKCIVQIANACEELT